MTQARILIEPELVAWARKRAGLSEEALAKKMSVKPERLRGWQTGDLPMTFGQIKKLAAKTYTPLGYLFAPKAPRETLPIADFRTFGDHDPAKARPSGAMLTTIYTMQRRQNWYRDYLMEAGAAPVALVGRCDQKQGVSKAAAAIRQIYRVDEGTGLSEHYPNRQQALRELFAATEDIGILTIRNGVVGNNTHRPLNVREFRGFALCDRHAPLIFINGKDARAAQLFTLAHELAHLCIEESGVSNLDAATLKDANPTEQFCNEVAAELLLPRASFLHRWNKKAEPEPQIRHLAESFNVSTQATARRAWNNGLISRQWYWEFHEKEAAENIPDKPAKGRGNFYKTHRYRRSNRFAKAVIACAREGALSYREAHELLDIRKTATFEKIAGGFGYGTCF